MTGAVVRDFEAGDAPRLLDLMRDLARFEDYLDAFAVTEADLLRHGLGPDALFRAFVAVAEGDIVGMAVTYVVPWTYTLRPKLVLKELLVAEAGRGRGTGRALMARVREHARAIGADHVAWTVMHGNARAEAFYRSVRGRPDLKWENWVMPLE